MSMKFLLFKFSKTFYKFRNIAEFFPKFSKIRDFQMPGSDPVWQFNETFEHFWENVRKVIITKF